MYTTPALWQCDQTGATQMSLASENEIVNDAPSDPGNARANGHAPTNRRTTAGTIQAIKAFANLNEHDGAWLDNAEALADFIEARLVVRWDVYGGENAVKERGKSIKAKDGS